MLMLQIKLEFLEILKKKVYFEEIFGNSDWYIQLKVTMLAELEIESEESEKEEKKIIKSKLEK